MISGTLLISRMVVGGAFRTGRAITVDGAGFTGRTTSLTWRQRAEGQAAGRWTSTTPAALSLTAASLKQNLRIRIQISFDGVCSLTLLTER